MNSSWQKLCLVLLATLWLTTAAFAQKRKQEHNYVPLREVRLQMKDFSFPKQDGSVLNLRAALEENKLVLIHYFAAWCHNSNYDVKTMTELYNKYREHGLLVIGVCEYSSPEELDKFIARHQPTYPICVEGDGKKKDRTGTTHYQYRSQIDDQRIWGTPLNVLIKATELQKDGETVARRVHIAPGEVIVDDIEELIRKVLDLKSDTK